MTLARCLLIGYIKIREIKCPQNTKWLYLVCSFPETVMAIWYENQGYYEQAKATYEGVVNRAKAMHNYAPAPPTVISEYKLWEQHWMKCAHELGQWDVLTEFGKSLGGANPFPGILNLVSSNSRSSFRTSISILCCLYTFIYIVLENAWRIADWPGMKESLHQVLLHTCGMIMYVCTCCLMLSD